MDHPELLSPAGDFSTGITALKSGADAVYCGLKAFSARRAAANLSQSELRRLTGFAHREGKKVYVTMNTVIQDNEVDEAARSLAFLEAAGVDAVILQDLGLLRLARTVAPSLPIHASTQMAIHTPLGAAWALRNGIARAILARELSLSEIKDIREAVPDLELEVFIHGALCYGFSGLCLASSAITGRSGNRGECAQICRTWFEVDGKKEFPFSSQDLAAGPTVEDLARLGVTSLKIEGRMKDPAYVKSTVAWYRGILDGSPDPEARRRSETAFSREHGTGFLHGTPGVTRDYPGHRGVLVGIVSEVGHGRFLLENEVRIEARDGLQFLTPQGKAIGFAAAPLGGTESGLWLESPKQAPPPGTEIYRVSDHDSTLKLEKAESYPEAILCPPVTFLFAEETVSATAALGGRAYTRSWPVDIQVARNPRGLEERFRDLFAGIALTVEGAEGRFVVPSALKAIRREFLQDMEDVLAEVQAPALPAVDAPRNGDRLQRVSYGADGLPFASSSELTDIVFLPPVQPREESAWREALAATSGPLRLGLGNPAHIELARQLAETRELECWVDYGLYAANRFAVEELKATVPNLKGVSPWIEDPAPGVIEDRGLVAIDLEGFSAPLFITRNCFEARGGSCPAGCPRRADREVTQRGRAYVVRTRDCLSYVLERS